MAGTIFRVGRNFLDENLWFAIIRDMKFDQTAIEFLDLLHQARARLNAVSSKESEAVTHFVG